MRVLVLLLAIGAAARAQVPQESFASFPELVDLEIARSPEGRYVVEGLSFMPLDRALPMPPPATSRVRLVLEGATRREVPVSIEVAEPETEGNRPMLARPAVIPMSPEVRSISVEIDGEPIHTLTRPPRPPSIVSLTTRPGTRRVRRGDRTTSEPVLEIHWEAASPDVKQTWCVPEVARGGERYMPAFGVGVRPGLTGQHVLPTEDQTFTGPHHFRLSVTDGFHHTRAEMRDVVTVKRVLQERALPAGDPRVPDGDPKKLSIPGNLLALRFSSDGQTLVAVSSGQVVRYATAGWKKTAAFGFAHDAPSVYTPIAISPDGLRLGLFDTIWDLATGRIVQDFRLDGVTRGGADREAGQAFSPDGTQFAVAGHRDDGVVKVWSISEPRVVCSIATPGKSARQLAWAPNGRRLAGQVGDRVVVWEVPSGRTVSSGELPSAGALAWSPDGTRVAGLAQDLRKIKAQQQLALMDAATGAVSWYPTGVTSSYGPEGLAFSPDGRCVAAGFGDGDILVWTVGAPAPSHRFKRDGAGFIAALAWSPDGQWLASGTWYGQIRVDAPDR